MSSGTVTVGVASAQLVGADGGRAKLLLQNLSANSVWLNFGGPVTAGEGLLLPPAPSLPIVLDALVFPNEMKQSIFDIASAAGSVVYYMLEEYPS